MTVPLIKGECEFRAERIFTIPKPRWLETWYLLKVSSTMRGVLVSIAMVLSNEETWYLLFWY
jgi:hypothetical protein